MGDHSQLPTDRPPSCGPTQLLMETEACREEDKENINGEVLVKKEKGRKDTEQEDKRNLQQGRSKNVSINK